MAEPLQAPRGTFDILPERAAARGAIEESARRILESAGYARIETPTFESTDLFRRGVGASTDVVQKEMYSFDDGGGRSMTLRPEGTAPVCRAYMEHGMHKQPQPVKLWYLSSFYRHEAPQAGRHRQFWQVGAEAIGSDDPAVDAELILLLRELLAELGADAGLRLRVSSLGTAGVRATYRAELQEYLREHEESLAPEVRHRIDVNPLRAFDSSDPRTREVLSGAPRILDRLERDDADHFSAVCQLLDASGVTYEIDPTLVRGLDYYTRTVFEFESDELGAQSGVGGGGRYDGLIEQLDGPATPGCGWAAGVERMLLASGRPAVAPPPVDLYVAYVGEQHRAAAYALAVDARRAGLRSQLELAGRGLKGQLKQSNRIGARFTAILGDDPPVALKDMESGEQRDVALESVIRDVLRGDEL